jgi:integrase
MGIKQLSPTLFSLDVRYWKAGKEYRRRRDVEGSRRTAQAVHDQLLKEVRQQAAWDSGSLNLPTFGAALRFYRTRHEQEIAGSEHYFSRLEKDLGEVTMHELRNRYDRWQQIMLETKTKDGRLHSPATMNRYLAWSKAAISYCIKRGLIDGANPLLCFEKRREVPRDLPFSKTDETNLLNVIDREAPYLSALVRFALAVPVRRGEALSMRVADVDLFNGCIRSRQGTMKGSRMAATKPIPPDAIVQRHFRTLPADCEYVWYRKEGGRNVRIKSFTNAWRVCTKEARLPGYRFHDLRHVAVTRMLNAGTPAQVVAQIAGWTSTAMIRQYYKLDGGEAIKLVRFSPNSQPETVLQTVLPEKSFAVIH